MCRWEDNIKVDNKETGKAGFGNGCICLRMGGAVAGLFGEGNELLFKSNAGGIT